MIEIYTDGACLGNPGPGGWAAVVVEDTYRRSLHGGEYHTTNNRMELLAVIKGLEAVPDFCEAVVFSDSQYVINTMTRNWKRKVNTDLWSRLDDTAKKHSVQWRWIRGHDGNLLNEMADKLAVQEAKSMANSSRTHKSFSHVDESGKASMVDIGSKSYTERIAIARCTVVMGPETLMMIDSNNSVKGDVLGVARIAGIMGAKNTAHLIPLCHPLPLDHIAVDFEVDWEHNAVNIETTAKTNAKTGVEMEAMTAASVAALTIYDMCKGVDRAIHINDIRLVQKTGGKSGNITLED